MANSLSPDDVEEANRQGWGLFEVWLPEKKRLTLTILPLTFDGPRIKSAPQAYDWVWERAKKGDAGSLVARRALQLIMNYGQKKK